MLKGCQRKIIMVKDTGSRYFDSAYFVIKHDLPQGAHESDMLAEAHRMIDACEIKENSLTKAEDFPAKPTHKQHKFSIALTGIILFFAGVSLSATVLLIFV